MLFRLLFKSAIFQLMLVTSAFKLLCDVFFQEDTPLKVFSSAAILPVMISICHDNNFTVHVRSVKNHCLIPLFA